MKSSNTSLQKWGGKVKIINLAMANIRKSKSASVSLFIFILIAALLLNIGLMGITQINPFFDNKADELNDPHVVFVTDQESYDPSYGDFLTNYPGVIRTETEEIINMDIVKFNFGKGELSNSAIFYNGDNYRMIGPLNIIEKRNTVSVHDIFVPYSFKTDGDYELGDNFTIHYQGKEYKYQIAGSLKQRCLQQITSEL